MKEKEFEHLLNPQTVNDPLDDMESLIQARELHKKQFAGDWSTPEPIHVIEDGDQRYSVIAIIGRWHVTFEGDLIFISDRGFRYSIWDFQLNEDNWVLHLTGKSWFTPEDYQDFKRAYFVACKIIGIEPPKQIQDYQERRGV